MSFDVIIISVGLMLPPLLIGAYLGWFVAGRLDDTGAISRNSFRKGAWITAGVAFAYYGFLALLAGINAADNGQLELVFYVVLPSAITAFLVLFSFGIYVIFNSIFKKIRHQ